MERLESARAGFGANRAMESTMGVLTYTQGDFLYADIAKREIEGILALLPTIVGIRGRWRIDFLHFAKCALRALHSKTADIPSGHLPTHQWCIDAMGQIIDQMEPPVPKRRNPPKVVDGAPNSVKFEDLGPCKWCTKWEGGCSGNRANCLCPQCTGICKCLDNRRLNRGRPQCAIAGAPCPECTIGEMRPRGKGQWYCPLCKFRKRDTRKWRGHVGWKSRDSQGVIVVWKVD